MGCVTAVAASRCHSRWVAWLMALSGGRIGYKFETLCLLPDTWDATPREVIEGRDKAVVNNYAQYCSIVQTGIGSTKLILGGEVDAGIRPIPVTRPTPYSPSHLTPSPPQPTLPNIHSLGHQTHRPNPPHKLGRAQNLRRTHHPLLPPHLRAQTPKILGPILPPRRPKDRRRLPLQRRERHAAADPGV